MLSKNSSCALIVSVAVCPLIASCNGAFPNAIQAERVASPPVDSPSIPGRIVIRFRDGADVGAVADVMFARGQSFASLTHDNALDAFLDRFEARSFKRVFASTAPPRLPPGVITTAQARMARVDAEMQLESHHVIAAARRARPLPGAMLPALYNIYLVEGDETADLKSACAELNLLPEIQYAEPERQVSVQMVPNDPYYNSSGSWGQNFDDLWGLKRINLEAAWDSYSGAGVVIAISDTGIDYTHEDIAASVWTNDAEIPENGLDDDGNGYIDDYYGYDFYYHDSDPLDTYGHGTHVAGTAAATGNNGVGVIGVAFGAKVMALKGFPDGSQSTGMVPLSETITYAADNGADIINASWGGPGSSSLITDAVNYALGMGCVFVCAAGNNGVDARYVTPANIDGVIAVGAIQNTDAKAGYSNFGGKVDVFAPGGYSSAAILSLLASNSTFATSYPSDVVGTKYFKATGTSMASPHVAGLAALLLEKTPTVDAEQIRFILRTTAEDIAWAPGWNQFTTWGLIDGSSAIGFDPASAPTIHSYIEQPAYWLESPNNYIHKGDIDLVGTAGGPSFDHYEIAHGELYATNYPVSWETVGIYSTPMTHGLLATIDTSAWTTKRQLIRLRTFDTTGAFLDSITVVSNEPGAHVGWPRLASAEWDSIPSAWRNNYNTNGLAMADLDRDGQEEVIAASESELYVWRQDGTSFNSAFPMLIGGIYGISSTPTVADLDEDGDLEIIVTAEVSSSGYPIYAFHHDGSLVSGFPAGDIVGTPRLIAIFPAVVADIDHDGAQEIVYAAGTRNTGYPYSYLGVLDANGNMKPGWPVVISSELAYVSERVWPASPITVADLDGDEAQEIFIGRIHEHGLAALTIYGADGTVFRQHTFAYSASPSQPVGPIIAGDLDRNGTPEYFTILNDGAYTNVAYLYDTSGNLKAGWPQSIPKRFEHDDYVAFDVDSDGELEIVGVASPNYWKLYAYNVDGTSVPDYPRILWGYPPIANLSNFERLAVAHLDAADPAIFLGTSSGYVSGLDAQGNSLVGWQKYLVESRGTPAVSDLDMDGNLDIGFHSMDGFVYIWQEPSAMSFVKMSEWPTLYGDNRRTGTPFIPEMAFTSFEQTLQLGQNFDVGIRWVDLPSDVYYRIVVNLINTQPPNNTAASTIVEHFADTGFATIALAVDPGAVEGTEYQLTARCEYRQASHPIVAQTSTPASIVLWTDTEPPSIPQNLTATAISSTRIDLDWDPASDNQAVTGYEIERNGAVVATVPLPPHSDIGLDRDTSYQYRVRAFDGQGNSSDFSPPITEATWPNQNPTISTSPVLLATEHQSYVYDVDATDPENDGLTYSLTLSPPGMGIDEETGIITWAPEQADVGDGDVSVLVLDGFGGFAEQPFIITVVNVNDPPVITTAAPTAATEDMVYTYDAEVADPDGPGANWTKTASDTCGGMLDGASGLYEFTALGPTPPASCVLSIQVCDDGSPLECAVETVTVSISAVNDAPVFTSTPITEALERTLYLYDADATDPENNVLYFSLELAPAGMIIGQNDGVIQWTPTETDVGANDVIVRVEDGNGGVGTQAFVVSVVANPCGNGTCEPGEDCQSCPDDCSTSAGYPGDGVCDPAAGENCANTTDCNGKQSGSPSGKFCCGFDDGNVVNPVGCSDSRCTASPYQCQSDVSYCCGDAVCAGPEDSSTCAVDCGAPTVCGDASCDAGEDSCNCAADCGAPPATELSCTDGIDNDCDEGIDCADTDCSADPACQVPDCSQFGDKTSCNAQVSCRWNQKTGMCSAV